MSKTVVNPKYIRAKIVPLFTISKIVTIHYFEFSSDFEGPVEAHDFWEFVYVDKGAVVQTIGEREQCVLAQGDFMTIRPNVVHSLHSHAGTNPNVFIISFVCHSKAMGVFRNKKGTLPAHLRRYIADIVSEARQTYRLPFNDPGMLELLSKESGLPGGQQLIQLYLEQLFIHLYRTMAVKDAAPAADPVLSENIAQNAHVNRMIAYIRENLYRPLSPGEVCARVGYSGSYLSTLFRRHCGSSIAGYINRAKIDEAKNLIRRGASNFAEIAAMLGYSDPHYFSRTFKKVTGMSPSEYRRSVQL